MASSQESDLKNIHLQKRMSMRGFLLWFGDAFAHAMGALSWEDKKTVPPSIGMQPYTGVPYKRGHGY